MNLNYEKINKKLLQNSKNNDIMNGGISKRFKIEPDLPDGVKGNAQWVKDMYNEIEARPAIGIAEQKRKDGILSEFAKEAESIYKLDSKNRELPTIKDYMRGKYSIGKTSAFKPEKTVEQTEKSAVSTLESRIGNTESAKRHYGSAENVSKKNVETKINFSADKSSLKPTWETLDNTEDKPKPNDKSFDKLSYEQPTVKYTNYSSKGETNRNLSNKVKSTNFDYNTTLSYSQEYDPNVELLQNRLENLGYIDMSEGGWGYYGPKTVAAVNAYKEEKKLGNDGEYRGVVDKKTWNSLGLLSREQKDIDAGVEIVTIDNKQYYDVTTPIKNALNRDEKDFEKVAKSNLFSFVENIEWFIGEVSNAGKWNIKNQENGTWEDTLGISSNTYYGTMIFDGQFVTAEDMGNITFGYLGRAAGFSDVLLKSGSLAYHVKHHKFNSIDEEKLANEYADHYMIIYGAELYDKTH